jgi:hypothetical protein
MSHTPSAPGGSATRAMTLERLRGLLDAHGARAEQWPSEERAAALALLGESSEARALQTAAARVDAALDLVPAPQPSLELIARILAAAPGAPTRLHRHQRRWRVLAAAVPLAAAAAARGWLLPSREPARAPVQYAIEDLGRYTTPTDLLLVPPGFDLSGTLPALGCDANGLGCPELEPVVGDQSRVHSTGGSYV